MIFGTSKKERQPHLLGGLLSLKVVQNHNLLLSSRLYCRYRNHTGSAVKYGSRTFTAGGELHPAPKNFLLFIMHYIPCIHILQLFFPCCRFKFLLWPPEAMYVPLPPAWGQRFHKPFYDMHLTTAVLLLSTSPEE